MEKIVSNEVMRQADKQTIEQGTSSLTLIDRAANALFSSFPWQGRIGIVCGKGNNGGDGIALSILLKENDFDVSLILIDENISRDSRYYFQKAKEKGIPIFYFSSAMPVRERFFSVMNLLNYSCEINFYENSLGFLILLCINPVMARI